MSFTKTYFLCPTSDFIHPPPVGPLNLGSIIRSTSTPQYPLNKASIVSTNDLSSPPVIETDWKKTISTEKGFSVGVYAQFLQIVLGPELSLDRSTRTENTFAFDSVTTLTFEPTEEYVKEAIKAPAIQAWLREPKQRFGLVSELFIVTGLKLVKGAKIKYAVTKGTTLTADLGLDVTGLSTTVGPKGHWAVVNDDVTKSHRESEFVFAFRVKRLRFGRRLKLLDYNKGALMTVSGKKDDADDLCVMVEDVDGADIQTAEVVPDVTENGNVYCVAAGQ